MNKKLIAAAFAGALIAQDIAKGASQLGRSDNPFRRGAWLRAERKRRRREVNASQRRNRR